MQGEKKMLKNILDSVRNKRPTIHCITNYVTINDVANSLLALGAKPVMSESAVDIEELTSGTDGLYLNIGMLSPEKLDAMILAGRKANELGHPVVLDPVGCGSSSYRLESARILLSEVHFDAVRGNAGEIRALCGMGEKMHGVDDSEENREEEMSENIMLFRKLAISTGSVIIASGKKDLITDGKISVVSDNGTKMLRRVTGSGCMLSALVCAFITSCTENALEAALYAVSMMNVSAEKAFARMNEESRGNVSFRNYLIDNIYLLSHDEIERSASYEVFR